MPKDNPFDGMVMHINFEEKEWTGGYINICTFCNQEFIFNHDENAEDNPVVLTNIQNVYLEEDKYFCSFDHMEDWLNTYVAR